MRLFIAEKPNMGRSIAECLNGRKENDKGFIRVGNDIVTWCVGHLYGLANPDHYNPEFKSWSLEHLPIIPAQMEMIPNPDTKAQLAIIKKLLREVDEVVHAGDPGREGQMIVDEVLENLGNRKPVKRLLLNAVDPGTIKKQLAKLEDNRKFALVYEEAKCRSYADWLVGMNLSRAATKTIAGANTLISIGRVQTVVLALIVNRCKTIEDFVPRSFFDIEAKVESRSGEVFLMKFSPTTEEARIWEREKAEQIARDITDKVGTLKVETQKKSMSPPKLFSLGSLQNEAGRKLKLSALDVLEHAQKLYEMGCTTYPRTECVFLPEEQIESVSGIVDAISKSDDKLKLITDRLSAPYLIRKTIFNNKKMEGEEHHAIIPTSKPLPDSIQGTTRALYNLIAKKFAMSLYDDFEYNETTAQLPIGDILLKAKGVQVINQGWKSIDGNDSGDKFLPEIADGEKAKVIKSRSVEGKTTPPSYYLEGVLVDEEMGGIAKYVTDPKIKAVLKETSGIGTAATRASFIETLKKRGYIWVNGDGHVLDTKLGRSLIEVLPKRLTIPDITAKWEMELKEISKGNISSKQFMDEIIRYVNGGIKWFIDNKGKVLLEYQAPPVATKPRARKTSGVKKTTTGTTKPRTRAKKTT